MPSDTDLHWNSPSALLVRRPTDPDKNCTIQSLWSPAYQLLGIDCFNNALLFQGCILENSYYYEKGEKNIHHKDGKEGEETLFARVQVVGNLQSHPLKDLLQQSPWINHLFQSPVLDVYSLPPTNRRYIWLKHVRTHATNINTHITWRWQTFILLKMLANLQLGNS